MEGQKLYAKMGLVFIAGMQIGEKTRNFLIVNTLRLNLPSLKEAVGKDFQIRISSSPREKETIEYPFFLI